jgi:tripartite-type tricarboxylate transporter receptor subunit TctC
MGARFSAAALIAITWQAAIGAPADAGYPYKPIRLVSTGAGSSNDTNARLVARGLSAQMGQPIVLDNRDGSVTPGVTVAQAPADGYTLLFTGGTHWIVPLVQKTPYDAIRDFAPITLAVRTPKVLVVNPSLPVKTVRELIDYAKARPGALTYASSGVGATSHIAVEQFNAMAGIKMVHVPFKANAVLMASLMSGETQLAINSPAGVMGQVKAES